MRGTSDTFVGRAYSILEKYFIYNIVFVQISLNLLVNQIGIDRHFHRPTAAGLVLQYHWPRAR